MSVRKYNEGLDDKCEKVMVAVMVQMEQTTSGALGLSAVCGRRGGLS